MDNFIHWFRQVVEQLAQLMWQLKFTLTERLLPIVEQLRPFWQDPLWQALGLIAFLLLLVYMVVRLLKTGNQLFFYLIELISSASSRVTQWVFNPFYWLYQRIIHSKQNRPKPPRWRWLDIVHVRRAANAIQYLTTKRDWRYNTPWFLLIGEQNSGKSRLIQSVTEGRRAQILPKEKRLSQPGSGWHFFDHAIVIDYNNKVKDDYNNKVYSNGDLRQSLSLTKVPERDSFSTQYLQRFNYLIELLHWYRPERALDGILLTVSAKTLLKKNDPASLLALGDSLFQQLWQAQKQSGFVLPVYLVVTQCDTVIGYESFWKAQQKSRRNEMIGWSNPYRLDSAFSKNWLAEAFTQILKNLEEAQLQVAASGQPIDEIDDFMLFRQNFNALNYPLTKVISTAFARSSFQEALPLRGIYFTGEVDSKISFVNDLIFHKVFAEKNLAFPLEKRRFSTQTILRRFQFGSIIIAFLLVGLMGYDSVRLKNDSNYTVENLRRLVRLQQDCTPEGLDTYRLLSGLTNISNHPLFMSLPLSWFDTQQHKEQHMISRQLLNTVLFSSLECRLKIRAETLRLKTLTDNQQLNYRAMMNHIKSFGLLLQDFQLNRERFLTLAGPLNDTHGIGKKLAGLLKYLYDRPIPSSVNPDASLTVGAMMVLDYNVNWDSQEQGLIDRNMLLTHLEEQSKQLHTALIEHAQQLPISELRQISENAMPIASNLELPPSSLLENIKLVKAWLLETEQDWLSANASTSPCGNIYQLMNELTQNLVDTGFDEHRLSGMVNLFSQTECDHRVINNLAHLNVPPSGPLFERNDAGRLKLSPVMQQLSSEVNALDLLTFFKSNYPPVSDSAEPIVSWNITRLQEVINTLLDYQQFLAEHSQHKTPFFSNVLNRRLQQVVERLLSQAMIRPSQQPQVPYLIDQPAVQNESVLSHSVASFKTASRLIMKISSLLRQLNDNANTIRLQQNSHTFVLQQLDKLDQIVADNQLYKPAPSVRWDKRDFARILFNLDTDKQIESYLNNQNQRMSFLAFNYAEPLISYLQNSRGGGLNHKTAQRWLHTLTDIGRFQRNEPGNETSELNKLISETLADLTDENCNQQLVKSATNHSWFATRRVQLQRQVNSHCQLSGGNRVIKRYLAIRKRFNQQLAGKFPFADVTKAGVEDINSTKLRRFFQYYRQASHSLLADMIALAKDNPGSMPDSWRDFISQMNGVSEFFKQSWRSRIKNWHVPLNVEFSALSRQDGGSNQIINWTLDSGSQRIRFPNGGEKISWQLGDPLKLALRWASGSAFAPLRQVDNTLNKLLQVDRKRLTATFKSRGDWGLFEWLARYGSEENNGLSIARKDEHLLAFHVPVILKNQPEQSRSQSYISRSNLLMWVEYTNTEGDKERLTLPSILPAFAPGFND